LFDNQLTGRIPAELFANCTKLKEVDLNKNKLTGAIPKEVGNCVDLEKLFLVKNQLTGSIPAELFAKCTKLKEVELSINKLAGAIPKEVGNCVDLEQLGLHTNQLTGSIPESLLQCTKLTKFSPDDSILASNASMVAKLRAAFPNADIS